VLRYFILCKSNALFLVKDVKLYGRVTGLMRLESGRRSVVQGGRVINYTGSG